MWTRRSVLRALGASAASPLLAPLAACMRPSAPAPGARRATDDMEQLRAALRAAVAEVSQRGSRVFALAVLRDRGRVLADADEHAGDHAAEAAVVLGAIHGARQLEQVTRDTSPDSIALAAAELGRALGRARAGARDPGAAPQSHATAPAVDPALTPWPQWIERARALYERSRQVGGSRIVYRGAHIHIEDERVLHVSADRDLMQRVVRARAGVVLVAQRGTRAGALPMFEVAERSGLLGLEATDLPAADLELAAERVRALVTPSAPASGLTELVLAPSVSAMLARACVGQALRADLWIRGQARAATFMGQRVGAADVTLIDDPAAPGAFGSYFFDDEGEPATRAVLIDRGVLVRPITDAYSAARLALPRTANGRRHAAGEPVAPRLSNVAFAGGAATAGELVGAVSRGLLLEGAMAARSDPRTWRFELTAARARQIVNGKLTGVLHGVVHVRGDVPSLLAAVQGASREIAHLATSEPLAATMAGPYLLTRAEVA